MLSILPIKIIDSFDVASQSCSKVVPASGAPILTRVATPKLRISGMSVPMR